MTKKLLSSVCVFITHHHHQDFFPAFPFWLSFFPLSKCVTSNPFLIRTKCQQSTKQRSDLWTLTHNYWEKTISGKNWKKTFCNVNYLLQRFAFGQKHTEIVFASLFLMIWPFYTPLLSSSNNSKFCWKKLHTHWSLVMSDKVSSNSPL